MKPIKKPTCDGCFYFNDIPFVSNDGEDCVGDCGLKPNFLEMYDFLGCGQWCDKNWPHLTLQDHLQAARRRFRLSQNRNGESNE